MNEIEAAIYTLKQATECRCDVAYLVRGRHDPFSACDYAADVKVVSELIESLNTRLVALEEAAREVVDQDAKPEYNGRYDELRARIGKLRDVLGAEIVE